MDVFKKLAAVGRSISASRDDADANGDDHDDHFEECFCYHPLADRQQDTSASVMSSSPLRRPPALITSTEFDNDEKFAIVATALLFRYEHENMNEREAIDATLSKDEDKRAFLEAIDLKYASTNLTGDGMMEEDSSFSSLDNITEILLKTRSIFVSTLQAMWRETEILGNVRNNDSTADNCFVPIDDKMHDIVMSYEERYQRPPKTPKNLRMSPVECAYKFEHQDTVNPSVAAGNDLTDSLKRRRRWFFAETDGCSTTSTTNNNTPFALKKHCPRFQFRLGGKLSMVEPVQSLQLDGFESSFNKNSMYMPPTSPIRKVSIDMHHAE